MSSQRYSPQFKDEAVRQVIERGYSVSEVSERLGVSGHSLYRWVKALTGSLNCTGSPVVIRGSSYSASLL